MTTKPRTKLEALMIAQGRVQLWVADGLDVDPSTVNRWIAGTWVIPARRVSQLAALLGVPESEIEGA